MLAFTIAGEVHRKALHANISIECLTVGVNGRAQLASASRHHIAAVALSAEAVGWIIVLAQGVHRLALPLRNVESDSAFDAVVVGIEVLAVGVSEEDLAVAGGRVNCIARVARCAESIGKVGCFAQGIQSLALAFGPTVEETHIALHTSLSILGFAVGVFQL